MGGVLIVGEPGNSGLNTPFAELATVAVRSATDGPVSVALMGADLSRLSNLDLDAQANRLYLLEHEKLLDGGTGGFEAPVFALQALCRAIDPELVVFSKTDFGSNVAPRLAFRLGVPVAQDCVDISRDSSNGRLLVTRPVYGGNAMAVLEFGVRNPQIVIARTNAFAAAEPRQHTEATPVERFDVSSVMKQTRACLIETIAEQSEGVRLEDADVVIGGGRGLGGADPFRELWELASMLGGAVGASRAVCDAGWIDHGYQIGLTGKSISPRLYLAIGISGASQHMAGCAGAKVIVAINKDAEANIFKEAQYGVVGDWQKVMPAFIATLKDLVSA